MDLRDRLEGWRHAHGLTKRGMAEKLGVHEGLYGKWVHADARYRVTPQKANLLRIAEVTRIPYTELKSLADPDLDLPADMEIDEADPIVVDLRARMRRMEERLEALDDVPKWAWEPYLRQTFDRAEEDLDTMIKMVSSLMRIRQEQAPSTPDVRNASVPPVRTPKHRPNAGEPPLTPDVSTYNRAFAPAY